MYCLAKLISDPQGNSQTGGLYSTIEKYDYGHELFKFKDGCLLYRC